MSIFYEKYWIDKEALWDLEIKWPILKRYIPLSRNINMLDFGCGKGVLLQRILKVNPTIQVSGVDISRLAISVIRKQIPKANFTIIEDGGKIPFRSNSFDFITATDVLEHVLNTRNAFSELARVLKPGGVLFISVPYHGLIKNIVASLVAFDQYFNPYQGHIRFYTKNNLESCIREAGMKDLISGYYGRIYPVPNAIYKVCSK